MKVEITKGDIEIRDIHYWVVENGFHFLIDCVYDGYVLHDPILIGDKLIVWLEPDRDRDSCPTKIKINGGGEFDFHYSVSRMEVGAGQVELLVQKLTHHGGGLLWERT